MDALAPYHYTTEPIVVNAVTPAKDKNVEVNKLIRMGTTSVRQAPTTNVDKPLQYALFLSTLLHSQSRLDLMSQFHLYSPGGAALGIIFFDIT